MDHSFYDDGLSDNSGHFSDVRAAEVVVTPAAILYVLALIGGGLGLLGLFAFAHTLPVVIACVSGILLALGGAIFAVRSVTRRLRAS